MKRVSFRGLFCKLLVVVCLCLGTLGCREKRIQQGCRMTNEFVQYKGRRVPSSVALEKLPNHEALVAWSVDTGTFYITIGSLGKGRGSPIRVGLRSDLPETVETKDLETNPKTFWAVERHRSIAAVDLATSILDNGDIVLAALEKTSGSVAGGAYLIVIDNDKPTQHRVISLGPAGLYAGRISVSGFLGGALVVWHEGSLQSSNLRMVHVDIKNDTLIAEATLLDDYPINGPSVAALPGGDALLVWSKIISESSVFETEIMAAAVLSDLKLGKRHRIAQLNYMDPDPFLVARENQFTVSYRDDADEDNKAEFYIAHLNKNGSSLGPGTRISRSDGFEGPSIASTKDGLVSSTIRSFERSLLVGVNRFSTKGVKKGGEYQVYADKSNFTRVDLAVDGNDILLVYAEERENFGRVLSSKVVCQ